MTGGRNGKGYDVLATPFRCAALHDTLLHTEKPPYRFHPYGGFSDFWISTRPVINYVSSHTFTIFVKESFCVW